MWSSMLWSSMRGCKGLNPLQAIEYMEAHTILAPSDVVTEVERCDWPPLEPGIH